MSELGLEYDCDAWNKYPRHRWLFNKLELALKLEYKAGPAGVVVPNDGDYVVRPVYNLSGMGIGARRENLKVSQPSAVKPGEFWCEYFHGPNVSIDYVWDSVNNHQVLRPVFAAQGFRTGPQLYRFNAWKRINPPYWVLPKWISELRDVPRINIEFIHDKIIEIHLRRGVDFPDGVTEIIPVWSDMTDIECKPFEKAGFQFHEDHDDADGHLDVYRIGFLCR